MDEAADCFDPDQEVRSEGWWASVLAEEEGHHKPAQHEDWFSADQDQKPAEQNQEINWILINRFLEEETIVYGTVVDFNKGGLLVSGEYFHGFVPISHLDDVLALEGETVREESLKDYKDRQLRLKVIECDQQRGRVVLSERAAQTAPGQRQRLLNDLTPGQVVDGRATNITDFGVFVDLGGVEGLIHISELSWGRVIHPRDYATIGETFKVKVLQVNKEKCRVSLSVKRLETNPWVVVAEKYPSGTVVDGTITELVKYGAFTRLDDGLEGLIHVSEMDLHLGETPAEVFSIGQRVKVEVVKVDSERQRMSLRLVV